MNYRYYDVEAEHVIDFRRTVLIVDDELVNLRIMGNILGEEYDILYANDGAEALDIIKSQKDILTLILLDLKMPKMHGYDVLEVIQKDEELRKIPVIVFTADIDAEVDSLQRGAVDFISKPFGKPEVIRARVKRAIELYIDKDLINNAGIDPLTGLFTKQFFLQYAQEYDKYHPDMAMDAVVIDLSKFHLLNELYGRTYGDKVLCAIAEGVKSVTRTCGGIWSFDRKKSHEMSRATGE
jgi:PleD family two-component response regulator